MQHPVYTVNYLLCIQDVKLFIYIFRSALVHRYSLRRSIHVQKNIVTNIIEMATVNICNSLKIIC